MRISISCLIALFALGVSVQSSALQPGDFQKITKQNFQQMWQQTAVFTKACVANEEPLSSDAADYDAAIEVDAASKTYSIHYWSKLKCGTFSALKSDSCFWANPLDDNRIVALRYDSTKWIPMSCEPLPHNDTVFHCVEDPVSYTGSLDLNALYQGQKIKFWRHRPSSLCNAISTDEFTTDELLDNAADLDLDHDGFIDPYDNCSDFANASQKDVDGDGVGDACDNCVNAKNPGQQDADGDDIGDACQVLAEPPQDTDTDGIADDVDNCPDVRNGHQQDSDEDGLGDACDVCPEDADVTHQDPDLCVFVDESVDPSSSGDATDLGLIDDQMDEGLSVDGGGACSMIPAANTNPIMFLILSAAFLPLAIRRRSEAMRRRK
jgi:hypothetical protein